MAEGVGSSEGLGEYNHYDDAAAILGRNLELRLRRSGVDNKRYVHPDLFLDESGQPQERTVSDVLNHFALRPLQTVPADFNLK